MLGYYTSPDSNSARLRITEVGDIPVETQGWPHCVWANVSSGWRRVLSILETCRLRLRVTSLVDCMRVSTRSSMFKHTWSTLDSRCVMPVI
ncbi:hypothetical protein CT19431_40079 [Cupriavidus taiwanensis]|nr:hypothetical protein CT19431_40079 [Cupriavidus taiwanensis]